MKRATLLFTSLFCLCLGGYAQTTATLQSKPTATAPAGDDWLLLQGPTHGQRKLAPAYYQPADASLLAYAQAVDAAARRDLIGAAAATHTHTLSSLTQSGATTGQVATWNGSEWVPATPSSGGGTGDMLRSTYDANTDGIIDAAALPTSWASLTITGALNVPAGGVSDAAIAATIARDSEVTAAVAAETSARGTAITAAIAQEVTDRNTAIAAAVGGVSAGSLPVGLYAELPTGVTPPATFLLTDGNNGTPTRTAASGFTGYVQGGGTLAATTVDVAAGTYTSAQSVTISGTAGSTIRYTTDGQDPTRSVGSTYSTPVSIAATSTLKHRQVRDLYGDGPVTSTAYTINVVTSLFTESFEGTGAPANWVAPGGSGTVNWDNATALVGTQSMSLYNNATATVPAVATGEIWVRFAWRLETTAIQRMFFRLLDGSDAIILRVGITSTGYITVQNLAQNTVATATTGAMPSANTWYYMWVRYVPGTGANAIIQVFGSTNATRPSTPDVSVTNWTGTATVGSVQFASASSATLYFDDTRAQTTTLD